MASLDVVRRMKLSEPDHYHGMVKMHLSFLLDLHTDECDCSFLWEKPEKDSVDSKFKKAFSTPMSLSIKKSKVKGVMDGVPLTQEGVCQVYQIIEYLGRPHNITQEGLFRKHGNLKKQQALKERLNKGVPLNLDEEEFSVHECAAVLKNFLAMLPEPLLTDAYYRAHCQVPLIRKEDMTQEDDNQAVEKQVACVQLLFQLIPEVNLALLRDLLPFLSNVAMKEAENKMNSTNLGTLFSTHILCPRKLSPEVLQSNHQLLSKAVTFMIQHADKLFSLPDKITMDIHTYISRKDNMLTPKCKKGRGLGCPDSPVVSTIFSFVDREASLRATHGNETDHALAQLYAHVQGMPESAHKRRLVGKLNDANGKGTPDVATSGSVRTTGKGMRQRRRSGDGIINLLTPRRKRPAATGSYSVQEANETRARREIQPSHSFKRQNSLHVPPPQTPSRTLSPSSHSSPAVLSPYRERLPSPHVASGETPASQASEVCPIDEVDTPGKDSSFSSQDDNRSDGEGDDLSGSYSAPPLPPRTPAPAIRSKDFLSPNTPPPVSPMTQAITTPRSRGGVMVCSSTQLDRWNMLLNSQQSPCQPHSYNEDEPSSSCNSSISSLVSQEDLAGCSRHERGKDSVYRRRSLSTEFKAFLAEHGMEAPDSESEVSLLDSSYSDEVRRLLRSDQKLSTSLQAALDGEDPVFNDSTTSSVLGERSGNHTSPGSCNSSILTVKSVSDSVSTLTGDSNTTVQMFLKEESENVDPAQLNPRRGIKRRSITEGGPQTAAAVVSAVQNSNSIIFETDL